MYWLDEYWQLWDTLNIRMTFVMADYRWIRWGVRAKGGKEHPCWSEGDGFGDSAIRGWRCLLWQIMNLTWRSFGVTHMQGRVSKKQEPHLVIDEICVHRAWKHGLDVYHVECLANGACDWNQVGKVIVYRALAPETKRWLINRLVGEGPALCVACFTSPWWSSFSFWNHIHARK